jgi:hypothetical protein
VQRPATSVAPSSHHSEGLRATPPVGFRGRHAG